MIRVLIVDDQNLIRQGLHALLASSKNIEIVGFAKDGTSALKAVEHNQPDIVLMDIEMPGLNGIIATKKIRQKFPQIKIIVLTSHANQEYISQVLGFGANGYILKDSLFEDLEHAIGSIYRGYSQVESRLLEKVIAPPRNVSAYQAKSYNRETKNNPNIEIKKSTLIESFNVINDFTDTENKENKKSSKDHQDRRSNGKVSQKIKANIVSESVKKQPNHIQNNIQAKNKFTAPKISEKLLNNYKKTIRQKNQTLKLQKKDALNARWLLTSIFLILVTTIAVFYSWRNYQQANQKKLQQEIDQKTVLVMSKNLELKIQADGSVKAFRSTIISPKEADKLEKLFIEEGESVTQGKIIAQMNNDSLQAEVNQQKAAVKEAQANLDQVKKGNSPEAIAAARFRVANIQANINRDRARLNFAKKEKQANQILAKEGGISRSAFDEIVAQELEANADLEANSARLQELKNELAELETGSRSEEIAQAQAQLEQAEAELNLRQINLNKTFIRAPFDGIITQKFAEEGDFVSPTTQSADIEGKNSNSIVELSSGLEIEAKINEADITKIKPGQNVDIKIDAYPNESFTGKVRLISPRAFVENDITFFQVKISIEIESAKLQLGMNARLIFNDAPVKDTITIPLAAVVTRSDGNTGVYLANQTDKSNFQLVKLGLVSGNIVQVKQGLKEGDRILISPPENIKIEGVDL